MMNFEELYKTAILRNFQKKIPHIKFQKNLFYSVLLGYIEQMRYRAYGI